MPAFTRIRLQTHTLQQAAVAGISVPLAASVALCPAANLRLAPGAHTLEVYSLEVNPSH
ncbi:MAG: hypothetical protein QOI59_83 [Gammaproteobacteria bacterium]|nr:hypothetical protein [Gammaproteobacteria bacterium]